MKTYVSKGKNKAYQAWINMRQRCNNPACRDFKWYGARGIAISARWDSFAGFHADMGDVAPKLSLERLDNNKGYSAENCVWATSTQQANNQRVRCTNKSGHVGVFLRGDGYWIAKFKGLYLGCFSSKDEAIVARHTAEACHASKSA